MLGAVGVTLFAGACSVSEVRQCNGHEKPDKCPRLVSTQGLGVVAGQRHITLGWMKEFYLEIPDPNDCRLIVVVEKQNDLESVKNLLADSGRDISNICTINDQGIRK